MRGDGTGKRNPEEPLSPAVSLFSEEGWAKQPMEAIADSK